MIAFILSFRLYPINSIDPIGPIIVTYRLVRLVRLVRLGCYASLDVKEDPTITQQRRRTPRRAKPQKTSRKNGVYDRVSRTLGTILTV